MLATATPGEPGLAKQCGTIFAVTYSITHPGWGVDLVVADSAVKQSDGSGSSSLREIIVVAGNSLRWKTPTFAPRTPELMAAPGKRLEARWKGARHADER